MCGIYCCISYGSQAQGPQDKLASLLKKRGPDLACEHFTTVQSSSGHYDVSFYSTVLSLRGADPVAQPCIDNQTNNVLCWNGEAWAIGSEPVSGNDTLAVLDRLCKSSTAVESVVKCINSVSGPFALVFFDAENARLFFARDAFGRRSLLFRADGDQLLLSSVGDGAKDWLEVEPDGVYVIDFRNSATHALVADTKNLPGVTLPGASLLHFRFPILEEIRNLNASARDLIASTGTDAVCSLESHLRRSILSRVADRNSHNSSTIAYRPSAVGQLKADDASNYQVQENCNPAQIAILFSGGLDCTILARLISDSIPANETIDLLNVAFQNPRIHQSTAPPYEQCPDRITARSSLKELLETCPNRHFRLVEINVPYEESLRHRTIVQSLMYPHSTEMDLSISFALYFASQGSGITHESLSNAYTTPAKVLFSGLGADELFGGYQRHATSYARHGYRGLMDELELDVGRLGKRNLGRDDRVLSHSGRETRYPYLDEELIKWAVKTSGVERTGFGFECDGSNSSFVPGKLVLRQLAAKLGLVKVAQERKRAIQFGARTAKMDGRKVKGDDQIS